MLPKYNFLVKIRLFQTLSIGVLNQIPDVDKVYNLVVLSHLSQQPATLQLAHAGKHCDVSGMRK